MKGFSRNPPPAFAGAPSQDGPDPRRGTASRPTRRPGSSSGNRVAPTRSWPAGTPAVATCPGAPKSDNRRGCCA